jgi:hypothetical protein
VSDYKKLIEDIESKTVKSPSMGCAVDLSICSICGETGSHAHKGDVTKYDTKDYSNIQLIAFSMVPAPECAVCQQPMEYLKRSTDWTCRDAICKGFNISISTGIGGVIG